MVSYKLLAFLLSLLVIFFALISAQDDNQEKRPKILNMFSVVRFANGFCVGSNNKNGTCFSEEECTNRNGANAGSCAQGYGVCCVITLGCGGMASENCTYFESVGNEMGACRAKICPCSDNICQMRLDFNTFVINQPSTSTTSVAIINNNKNAFPASQCIIDQFMVTTPGNNPPPVICGTNTGEHMYFDASDLCNDLSFSLDGGTTTVTRTWSIKITQYDCNDNNLAPDGCTQYFFGSTTDQVKTYNFDGGIHLSDQDQNICIRRERGLCRICWTTQAEGDFETSTALTGAAGKGKMNSKCCGYGNPATDTAIGYDCAMIPSASKAAGDLLNVGAAYGFCGGELGTIDDNVAAATVCSRKVPFNIRFLSDHYEWNTEAPKQPNGFRLIYTMTSC